MKTTKSSLYPTVPLTDQAKPQIVLISEAFVGGVRTHLDMLLDSLTQKDWDILLLYSSREEPINASSHGSNVKMRNLTPATRHPLMLKFQFMASVWRASCSWNKVTILHAHGLFAFLILILLKIFGTKNKLVVTLHGGILHREGMAHALFKLLLKFSMHHITRFICVSEHDKQLHLNLDIPTDKLVVIPNAINFKAIDRIVEQQPDPYLSHQQVNIAIVSTLYPTKGIIELLEHLAQQQVFSVDQYRLTLVGTGPLKEQIKKIIHCSDYLNQLVHLAGYAPQPYNYLKWADIVLFPSRKETFGLVLHEALYLGAKVVAHQQPTAMKFLPDSCLVNFDNPHAILAAVETLLSSPRGHHKEQYYRAYDEFVHDHEQVYTLMADTASTQWPRPILNWGLPSAISPRASRISHNSQTIKY